MVKEMKWHIYHKITGEPLCWDKKALEFDTKEDTENFLGSVILNFLGNVEDFDKNTEIKEDILYYDDLIVNVNDLVLPHPRLHLRRFTLLPLCDIAPDFVHPVIGKTNEVLLEECVDVSDVRIIS